MEKKMIVFDLDGTLVDTRSAVFEALQKLAIPFHYESFANKDIVRLRNVRSIHLLKELGIPLWKAPFLLKRVQSMLGEKIADMSFIEGIPSVLKELKQKGYILGVATSNSKKNTDLFFAKYHGVYFDFKRSDIFVFGKHTALKRIAKKRGICKENMYYIGDETRDILAAKKAGIQVLAVTWGFNNKEILQSMNPDFIAEKPADILTFLEGV